MAESFDRRQFVVTWLKTVIIGCDEITEDFAKRLEGFRDVKVEMHPTTSHHSSTSSKLSSLSKPFYPGSKKSLQRAQEDEAILTQIYKEALEAQTEFQLSDINWDVEGSHSGAFVFWGSSGNPNEKISVCGTVFEKEEARGRGFLMNQLMRQFSFVRQLSSHIITFPISIQLGTSEKRSGPSGLVEDELLSTTASSDKIISLFRRNGENAGSFMKSAQHDLDGTWRIFHHQLFSAIGQLHYANYREYYLSSEDFICS